MKETPTIDENYPYGLSNRVIEKDIQEYSRAINTNRGRSTVSACYAPLIQLGQAELQLRLAKKIFWISIFLGCFSLIISFVALGLAYSANHSSDEWESDQIFLLGSINKNLEGLAIERQSTSAGEKNSVSNSKHMNDNTSAN
jgi:hypothetical protein